VGDVFGSQVPNPVRPIADDDQVGLVGHPAPAGVRPQLPAEGCGIGQRRHRALAFGRNDERLRPLARHARPGRVHAADFDLLPPGVVDVRHDAIHAEVHAGRRILVRWGGGSAGLGRGRHVTFVVGARRAEILGRGPHTIGTDLDETAALKHRRRLGERILGGAQQREQFVQTETETAGRDLELGIQRRLIYVGQR
jgi:hypothetical protein